MSEEVLSAESYVSDSGRIGGERPVAFAYSNSLSIASKADAEVRGDDSAVEIQRGMTKVGSKDDGHVQPNVVPDED